MEDPGYQYFETLENVYQETGTIAFTNGLCNKELFEKLKVLVEKLTVYTSIENLSLRHSRTEILFKDKDLRELLSFLYGAEYFLLKHPYRQSLLEQLYYYIHLSIMKLKQNPPQDFEWIKLLPKFNKDIEENLLQLIYNKDYLDNEKDYSFIKIKDSDITKNTTNDTIIVKRSDGFPLTLLKQNNNVVSKIGSLSNLVGLNNTDQFQGNYHFGSNFYSKDFQLFFAEVTEVKFGTSQEKTIIFRKNLQGIWVESINLRDFRNFHLANIQDISPDCSSIILQEKEQGDFYLLQIESKIIRKITHIFHKYKYARMAFSKNFILAYNAFPFYAHYNHKHHDFLVDFFTYDASGYKHINTLVCDASYLALSEITTLVDLNGMILTGPSGVLTRLKKNKALKSTFFELDTSLNIPFYTSEDEMIFGSGDNFYYRQTPISKERFKNKKTFSQTLYQYLKN